MGEVFRARDTKLRRDVALKVLPEQISTGGGSQALYADFFTDSSGLPFPGGPEGPHYNHLQPALD